VASSADGQARRDGCRQTLYRFLQVLAGVLQHTSWCFRALAEFQIQEVEFEQGEVELEYRGAYHWGVPKITEENENANDLRQSHEMEVQMAVTNW
jgi:hypothetical protein